MKSTITKIKNSLGFSSRFEQARGGVRESEDMSVEIIHSKEQKEKQMEKKSKKPEGHH